MTDVGIIDYGINNLKSVTMAFEKIGKSAKIIDRPEQVHSAKCLVLPGIGAFGDGMNGLRERGLIEPIKKIVRQGAPLLGICLGMQMLFTESEEFGLHKGLDLIPGRVIQFRKPSDVKIEGYKVPHMGWNTLNKPVGRVWKSTLLESTEEESNVYFVHSFYPDVKNTEYIVATTKHGDQRFCSVVEKENIVGTQFHPEKSGAVGLKILNKFCELNNI